MELCRASLMLAQGLLLLLFGMALAELKEPFSLERSARMLSHLRQRFTASCVYLLHGPAETPTTDFLVFSTLTKMEKILMGHHVPVSITPFPESDMDLRNHGNNSIHVIFANNTSAQHSLRKLSAASTLFSKSKWLLFLHITSLEDFFQGIYIPLNCHFLVVQPSGQNMMLSEVYRQARHLPLKVYKLGNWTSMNWTTKVFYENRGNLEGCTLKVTTLDYNPMLIFNESTDPPVVDGYFGQVWRNLERRMKFKSKYLKPLDNAWGSLKNGSWNGMVSLLLNGTADVAVNAFTMTTTRLKAVDFSSPVIGTSTCVFVALRKERTLEWGDYLKPFSGGLWVAVAASVVCIACYMSLLYRLALRGGSRDHEPQCENPLVAAFYVFGIFCQQGHDITPNTMSCRIVYFTTYVTAVILLASYSAGLIAFLTVVDIKTPFTSFRELLKRGDYKLGMAAKSGVLNEFDQAVDPLLRSIYKRLIAPGVNNLPSSTADVIRRLCGSKYAYMRSLILGVGAATPEGCNIVPVPRASFPETLGIMLPKHSPYREIINRQLQDMRELGVLQRIALTIWPKMNNLEANPFSTVGLENVVPILAVLSLGALASLLLLLFERAGCHVVRRLRRRCLGEVYQQEAPGDVEKLELGSEDRGQSSFLGASLDSRARRPSRVPEENPRRVSVSDSESDILAVSVRGRPPYLTDEEFGLKKISAVVEATTTGSPLSRRK